MEPSDAVHSKARAAARLLAVAGLLGALAVALGAFGAHTLRERLSPSALDWWRTATFYLLTHAVAGALAALASRSECARPRRCLQAARLLLGGALLFAATLYTMALGAPRALGMVTPLGGLAMIGGWLLLALAGWQARTGAGTGG